MAGLDEIQSARQNAQGWLVDETALALTFAAAMQGRGEDGNSLVGRPLYPAYFLRQFYAGPQDDAVLFLMQVLAACPLVSVLFRGRT